MATLLFLGIIFYLISKFGSRNQRCWAKKKKRKIDRNLRKVWRKNQKIIINPKCVVDNWFGNKPKSFDD